MTDYKTCWENHCAREASHRVTGLPGVRFGETTTHSFCLDHACKRLERHGDVSVSPIRGGDEA